MLKGQRSIKKCFQMLNKQMCVPNVSCDALQCSSIRKLTTWIRRLTSWIHKQEKHAKEVRLTIAQWEFFTVYNEKSV